jgi:hypothetical protein
MSHNYPLIFLEFYTIFMDYLNRISVGISGFKPSKRLLLSAFFLDKNQNYREMTQIYRFIKPKFKYFPVYQKKIPPLNGIFFPAPTMQ